LIIQLVNKPKQNATYLLPVIKHQTVE